jgi:site-specific DNA-adenine methylase
MRYQGGKNGSGVFQTIINRIPVHSVYVEPFAGSAAIYRRKMPAASSILVERDQEQASKLAMLASPSTIVRNADALDVLAELIPTMDAGTFVYLDPPYVHESRRDLNLYRFEMTDEQHSHLVGSLLPAMSDRGARWMLSGYRNSIYADASSKHGWREHDFQAMTRRGVATETLWMNYEPGAAVIAETTFAGSDFRERERIKRKAARWAAKFEQLQAMEQEAILTVLQDRRKWLGDHIAGDGGAVLEKQAGGPQRHERANHEQA